MAIARGSARERGGDTHGLRPGECEIASRRGARSRAIAIGLLALMACATTREAPAERATRVPAPLHERAPVVAAAEPQPVEDTRAYESVEERARIREILRAPGRAQWRGLHLGHGPVRLRLDGPVVDGLEEQDSITPYSVVESRDEHARIVLRHGNVVLLAWVHHRDFVPQPQQRVALATAPGRAPADGVGHLEIAPGERVEVKRTQGEWHEVELVRRSIRGWLPIAVFAPVFPVGGFTRFESATMGIGIARADTRVREQPGGRTLWRFTEDDNQVGILRETKGWLEIAFVRPCDDTIRIVGWVRRRDVGPPPDHTVGFGCGQISGFGFRRGHDDSVEVTLPADTELFDDQGRLVGLASEGNRLRRTPAGVLQVPSRWGSIPVFAEVEAELVPPTP